MTLGPEEPESQGGGGGGFPEEGPFTLDIEKWPGSLDTKGWAWKVEVQS